MDGTNPSITKVEVDGHGMSNVKDSIGFWGEPRHHLYTPEQWRETTNYFYNKISLNQKTIKIKGEHVQRVSRTSIQIYLHCALLPSVLVWGT